MKPISLDNSRGCFLCRNFKNRFIERYSKKMSTFVFSFKLLTNGYFQKDIF